MASSFIERIGRAIASYTRRSLRQILMFTRFDELNKNEIINNKKGGWQ